MTVPVPSKTELRSFKNPRAQKTDGIDKNYKVMFKELMGRWRHNHHNTIIPATKGHTSFTLGAQPGTPTINGIRKDNPGKKVHIISMLAGGERVKAIIPEDETVKEENGATFFHGNIADGVVDRIPWGDHGTMHLITDKDSHTVKNQTVTSMIAFQQKLHADFDQGKATVAFYCHCMAGRSRSFVETMMFIYFYPDKKKLFDFDSWPPEIRVTIPKDLQERLKDNPSFSDIAQYISLRRPEVKKLSKMDGDQAGLLGLASLAKAAKDGIRDSSRNEAEKSRLCKDAQNIGLMLKAPLDTGFRDPQDIATQEENLVKVYQAYKEREINLLMVMVVPIGETPSAYPTNIESFEKHFNNLHPSEQTRFAILLKKLEEYPPALDLGALRGKSSEYAQIAINTTKKLAKLSAGDQVEFLKNFGPSVNLDYGDVVKRVLEGNKVDRHNAGIQLGSLVQIAKDNHKEHLCVKAITKHLLDGDDEQFTVIKEFLTDPKNSQIAAQAKESYFKPAEQTIQSNTLSYDQQFKLVQKLQDLEDPRAGLLAKQLQTNYNQRGFFSKLFGKSLTKKQLESLTALSDQTNKDFRRAKEQHSKNMALEQIRDLFKDKPDVEVTLESREDIALNQFRDFINSIKKDLTTKDKQTLVRQFMADPAHPKEHPGNSERLKIVLAVCSKKELRAAFMDDKAKSSGESLLDTLMKQYPLTTDTKLAVTIHNLPEVPGCQSWQQHPTRARSLATTSNDDTALKSPALKTKEQEEEAPTRPRSNTM